MQAYGQRASEISRQPDANPKDAKSKIYGAFSAHMGLDASTIWAGATSGPSAIAVHLLACMLARTWSGPEAISIWWELIVERKKEIESGYQSGNSIPIATLMAAQQELRRDHLADWDASARSWLRSADRAKVREQKQLFLIVNNVEIAVNNTAATYQSVLAAWNAAMIGLENLLSGVSQRIQNGSVLLGFAAWHIFPDIIVLGEKITEVRFHDALVPTSGLLEIGLKSTRMEESRGVFWSLSLAHLRYYGGAVPVSKSASHDENRVSIDQLFIIALGSAIHTWDLGLGKDFKPIFCFLRRIDAIMSTEKADDRDSWIKKLLAASIAIEDSSGIEAKYKSLLFSYGRHQGKALIPTIPTYFGLNDYSTLLHLTTDQRGRIAILRDCAQNLQIPENFCIIRYRHELPDGTCTFEYASSGVKSAKRARDGVMKVPGNCRWIDTSAQECNADKFCLNCTSRGQTKLRNCFTKRQAQLRQEKEECNLLSCPVKCTQEILSNVRANTGEVNEAVFLSLANEYKSPQGPSPNQNSVGSWTDILKHQKFSLIIGDASQAGLFIHPNFQPSCSPLKIRCQNPSDLVQHISKVDMRVYFASASKWMAKESLKALKALGSAANIYQAFPNALFSLKVCSRPLSKASWIPKHQHDMSMGQHSYRLNRGEKFSCLAFFESGTCDVLPELLQNVMAMSTGDTLYISECLLSDPAVHHNHSVIRRVIGNVGRPGVSMLVSPGNVQRRELQTDSWMLIDPTKFDGTRLDSFSSTSMHLSFTGYELPIGNATGVRDIEAALVETAISILHCGKWVADIDLFSKGEGICLFQHNMGKFYRFIKLPERQANGDQMDCQHGFEAHVDLPLNAVDTWDELLAEPDMASIVRAHGNKIARVATTVVSLSIGREVHVLPENCCWQCLVDYFGVEGFFRLTKSVVIIM